MKGAASSWDFNSSLGSKLVLSCFVCFSSNGGVSDRSPAGRGGSSFLDELSVRFDGNASAKCVYLFGLVDIVRNKQFSFARTLGLDPGAYLIVANDLFWVTNRVAARRDRETMAQRRITGEKRVGF